MGLMTQLEEEEEASFLAPILENGMKKGAN